MLLNGIMNVIVGEGLFDEAFIEQRCENFDALKKNLEAYPIEQVAEYCDISADLIRKVSP